MVNLIATFIAALSMASQPQVLPHRFERCIEQRGHTVINADFIGRECRAKDGETWWAGLDLNTLDLVTGP
jgi:hypothetical protein